LDLRHRQKGALTEILGHTKRINGWSVSPHAFLTIHGFFLFGDLICQSQAEMAGRIGMDNARAIVMVLGLLGAGCSSLQLKSSAPKPIASKPPESAIVLSEPVTVNDKGATNVFPAGKYRPLYEDRGGYYFEAPTKVLVNDVASFGYDGGLYVARGVTEPTQWYFISPVGKKMGRFNKIPQHTLIH
jgi:hypothetical protein